MLGEKEKIIQLVSHSDTARYMYCLSSSGAIYIYDILKDEYKILSNGLLGS